MAETKKRTSPATFIEQVRNEGRKVTWTTRQETIAATIMVVIMVIFAAIFFLLTDMVVGQLVQWITGIE